MYLFRGSIKIFCFQPLWFKENAMSSFPVPAPVPIDSTPLPDAVVPHIEPTGSPFDYDFGTELPRIEVPVIQQVLSFYVVAIEINIPPSQNIDIGDFGYILTIDGEATGCSLLLGAKDSTGKVKTATLTTNRPSRPQPSSLGVTILCRKKVKPSGSPPSPVA